MLGTRCAAAGGVLVRNRRRTGSPKIEVPAEAPSESAGEWP